MKDKLSQRIICLIVALIALAVLLFPLYWMVVTALLPSSVILSSTPPLFPPPDKVTLDAFRQVIMRSDLLTWMKNSALITLLAAALSIAVSVMAGYSLSRFRSKAQFFAGIFLLLNRMLPGTLLAIPMFIMFSRMGLLNSPLSVVFATTTAIVPFSTWMMRSFFDTVPMEIDEAAKVDGCTQTGIFLRVVMPLTLPGIAATAIYSAILAWSDYIFSRTLLTSPTRWTMTIGTVSFMGEHLIDWSSLMAIGIISIVPLFVLFIFLEPYLVSGMTSGAVKG